MRSAALLFLAIFGAAACASSGPAASPVCASNAPCAAKSTEATPVDSETPQPAVAKVWRSRCGSCHVRVEPGTRDRATLETALQRHRTRVKMDETQWPALVDFLASR
jgi:hypothetical protein